jgi:hypothetical protein
MVLPTHVAKHNGEQCTAYSSRKHYRCPFKVQSGSEYRVCPKHAHYYEDWWLTHRPVLGWRSADRNLVEDYKNGFCLSGPPPQRYIDDLIDNVIYFDYWATLCLTFPETCHLDQKPKMLYHILDEHVRGRFPIHHQEWTRLLENPDGGVRMDVIRKVWENTCTVFFKKFTAMYDVLMRWWGEHTKEEIAECIQIQFTDDWRILETVLRMFEKVAPWYYFSGDMEPILAKFTAEFLKGCRGEFYEVEGQKCMDRIRQTIYDTKQKLYEDLKNQRGIMSDFFEELVATVWHPGRVGPWIEAYGINILESF